jgi:hypothetical protein
MLQPVTPPQTAPLLYDVYVQRTWYLFFDQLRQTASTGGGIVQYGSNAQRLGLPTQGLPDGALWYEQDTGLIYLWNGPFLKWVCVAGTQIIDQTLTGATTIAAPTTGAKELVVILRQDATGGRTITWGPGFSATSPSIDTTPSTISVFRFVLTNAGLYVMVGQPTTGMSA